jgi:hypothetical protein
MAQLSQKTAIDKGAENQLGGAPFMIRLNLRAMVNWYDNRKSFKYGNNFSFILSYILGFYAQIVQKFHRKLNAL